MSPEAHFRATAPDFMRRLLIDFPQLTDLDAAAVFGNAGHESKGLTDDQEDAPTVKGSRGGANWMQWTASRRTMLEAFAGELGIDPDSDEAAYLFLVNELRTTEKRSLAALRQARTLAAKTRAFMHAFLRPGIDHIESRQRWARIALAAYREEYPARVPTELIEQLQQALLDKGYVQVGRVDGRYGDKTRKAILAFEDDHHLPLTGEANVEILARVLASAPKQQSVERTETTPADVRDAVPEARATWQAQLAAFWGMVVSIASAAFGFIVQSIGEVRDLVRPVTDLFGDVPWWLYGVLVAAGLLYLWLRTKSANQGQLAAFRSGERR